MDWLPNVTKSDILEPLAGFPKDNADVTMLYERSRIDGISYTIPLFSNPYIFFYNINVLKSAGFDRPPKTRDEFLSYSRALKEKQIAGIGLALAAENHSGMFSDLYSWFWNSDISFITDGEPQFSTRPVLETLRFLETASKENLISPDSFHKTEQEKIDDFCSGKTAMMITSLSNLSQIKNKVKFEWGTSSIPTAASFIGNPLFVTESFSMGIYAQSEHKEEAWKFLAFLAGAAQNAELASSFNAIPANQNAQPLSTETLPQEEKALELINAGKLLNEFDMQPGVFMAEKIIRTELQKMMSGAISPELCAEAIQKQWENI
jgi:multiple sugar transport system substrate-binding protein